MSSHHFVKEDQEPALLIIEPDAAPLEQVKELLEWSPTVVVAVEALEEVLLWGIKIDVIITNQRKLAEAQKVAESQTPVRIITYDDHEDQALSALYFLQAGKYQAVNILGSDFNLIETTPSTLDIVMFHNNERWSFIRPGKFEKWVPAGRTFKIKTGKDVETSSTSTDGVIHIEKDKPFWISEN